MITGLFRIIFYVFLAYILFWLFRFFKAINKGSKSPKTPKRPSGIMVKDGICNTYLPKEDAIKEIYEGREYFFCSKDCQQKFLERKKPH
ncbi:MAG: YHS domain-containing protein [Candidatus Aminicenantes bacterium]|nr:YHS domain-containing protein [Candidatus Aminicenantes bacterium]